jgi:hypothetical protein
MADRETVKYKGREEFEKDREKWLQAGYQVEGIKEEKQRSGLGRMAVLGVGALVVKPKSHFHVTYKRGTDIEASPSDEAAGDHDALSKTAEVVSDVTPEIRTDRLETEADIPSASVVPNVEATISDLQSERHGDREDRGKVIPPTELAGTFSISPVAVSLRIPDAWLLDSRKSKDNCRAIRDVASAQANDLLRNADVSYPFPLDQLAITLTVPKDLGGDSVIPDLVSAAYEGLAAGHLFVVPEDFGLPEIKRSLGDETCLRLDFGGSATSREISKERIIWKGKASYDGGHPQILKDDKSTGDLRLTGEALEYESAKVRLRFRLSDIIEGSLGTFQPGFLRRALVNDSRILTDVRNALLLDFNYYGNTYRAEFHIQGALTVPGEADKARELLNALNSMKPKFNQPANRLAQGQGSQRTVAADADEEAVRNESGASSPSVTDRMRQLKQLLDDGFITEADYEEKKAELLESL